MSRRPLPSHAGRCRLLAGLLAIVAGSTAVVAGPQTSQAPTAPAFLLSGGNDDGTVRGKYLEATPATSMRAPAPGQPFTVSLVITPKPGVHVYAPGNKDYTAIAWTVDPMLGVTLGPVTYPKGTEYLFAPLKERVRVYSAPLRLERQVTIDPAGPLAKTTVSPQLALRGTLTYQACDDKVCYLPEELTLSWHVMIRRS